MEPIGGKTANTVAMAERMTRPLSTIMLITTLCVGFFQGLIGADVFVSIAGPVVTFWFAARQGATERASDKNGSTPSAPTAVASGPGATATVTPTTTP